MASSEFELFGFAHVAEMGVIFAVSIVLMLVGACACACFAAEPFTPRHPDPVHESWLWRFFPELKGQGVSCLAQDGDGNFLFGRDDGIYRYDGINWRLFPFDEGMVGAQINALYVARDGGIYVGSDRGISRFENGMWERVFPSEREWNTYDLMAAKDGSLWAGTEWGALRLARDEIRMYVAAKDTMGVREMVSDAVTFVVVPERVLGNQRLAVYDVCEAPDGAIWFGMYDGDLIRFDFASGFRRFSDEDGIDQGTRPRICVTEDGVVWVVYGDNSKRVNRFDGEKWKAFEVGDSDYHYTSILESRDGTLWIGGSRLIAYQDGVWRVYDSNVFSHCTGLHEAADGALWIIGREQEAARLDLSERHYQTYEGLIFQCDTPDGAQWFISQDNGVVRYDGQGWTRFGVADGLMDMPSKLIVTRDGALWAAGRHEHVAATALLDGSEWVMERHPQLSWGVDPRAVYEAFDGSLWFGAAVDWWLYGDGNFLGGVVVFDGASWTHHTSPKMTSYAYGIGQSPDGTLWFGGKLFGFDGMREVLFTGPGELTSDFIDAVYTTPEGDLWLGSRTYGVFRYDGTEWQGFDYEDGLADNRVQSIFQDRAGAIWVGTAEGVSRFDGRSWLSQALPRGFPRTEFYDPVLQSRDGALWLNFVSDVRLERSGSRRVAATLRTIRYVPETDSPETEMTIVQDEVSLGGEITFAWTGIDPWRSNLREDLQYAYRLNGGEWSPYGGDRIRSFEDLDVGVHTMEVKARDLAFNEDPIPARMSFNVVPLVWRSLWFIGLISGFVILTGFLVSRIIVRDRRLRQANEDLASANEAQLLQSARLVSLGQMVAGVAHELNQPLTVVEMTAGDICLRLMEGRSLEAGELREMMEDVRGVVNRMAGTVDHLRVFSRDVSEEPRQAMDVNEVIESSLKMIGTQLENRGIDLVLDLSDALIEVWGHPHPLEQVVLNLLSNARDAVDERVEMEGTGYDKQIWIRTRVEDDAAVIEVEDNGVGMDEAIRQRLFEPFFTTKDADRGTGLGLSIIYAIVRNHDGEITVESEEGVGTTFKVMLPVVE